MTRWTLPALVLLAACEKTSPEAIENATPSPNASILPVPLSTSGHPAETQEPQARRAGAAHTPTDNDKASSSDAGPAVTLALRGDQAPDDDSLTQRDLQGVTLEAEWRYPDAAQPPKAPEVNLPGIDAAKKTTAARMTIHLASIGRMRVVFDSRALPLDEDSEIRARSDLLGHVLVWPNGSQYRVLPPGAVRTLLGERRIDAVPLVRPQTATKGDGPHRNGLATRKWELATRTGKLVLEQGKLAAAGEGGLLLCRFLAELVAIDPLAAPCSAEDVPLRAQYAWPDGGGVVFEVTRIADRVDFSTAQLLVPPAGGEFAPTTVPPGTAGGFLAREELAAFRVRPFEGPVPRPLGAPDEGLVLYNGTDTVRYAFLDGVPVAWVAPNEDQTLIGLQRGHYVLQWRTFLGDAVEAPAIVEVPARLAIGAPVEAARDK